MKFGYNYIVVFAGIAMLTLWSSCQPTSEQAGFELLRKDKTGLDFENVITQTAEFNVFKYMYIFNGGGVAAGDFNNDGLQDLYFTSNMGPNKLFLNEGNLTFKDVTETAQVAGMEGGWSSGVTTIDINNDGMLDLYVSQVGDYKILRGHNQLFVCQKIENGIPIYKDMAAEYHLDLVGFGTQAAFFDYDLDGDLDMYQLNHSVHANGTFGRKKAFDGTTDSLSGDRLMRNDNGKFTDVTLEAGIKSLVIGYGLGIVTGDVNNDGYPDVYIGNDFHEDDYLYINQKDGTFKDMRAEMMQHTGRFAMGVEMGDINNDAQKDILSLDMLPSDPEILKASLGEDDFKIFKFKLGYGYLPQYARNNLQLNNGNGTFSEIGMFAGVHATDWSWTPLMMDFDHDGYRDIFISNGIPRRMNDIDYVNFRKSDVNVMWKTNNVDDEENLELIEMMPRIKLANKFFKNNGDLTFKDLTSNIKNDQPTFSNGAVYADLDNDGDLDIVVNNIEDEPFIYKNNEINTTSAPAKKETDSTHNFIHLTLKGSPQNINAIGAKLVVTEFIDPERPDYIFTAENFPVRGYQSSVQLGLHLGVGALPDTNNMMSRQKEAVLIWPDRTYQKLPLHAIINKKTRIEWQPNLPQFDYGILQWQGPERPFFPMDDITAQTKVDFKHDENPFVEFNREGLIPHMVSSEGPALAVGDLNGDGLDDFFVGNAKRRKAAVFYQNADGTFTERTPAVIANDSLSEEVDAVIADMDNDGDNDLVIANGGNEYTGENPQLAQRLLLNDGKGNFTRTIFPNAFMTASSVAVADVNGDQLLDVFFGGRAVPWNYGIPPTSYLFINKGNGKFEDQTQQIAPKLRKVGFVKDASFVDLDQDGDSDLLLAMEWERVLVFINDGKLKKQPIGNEKGWWNFASVKDYDGDGDIDILAGNLGKNAKLKPTHQQPVRMYVNDFDDNGQIEQVLTYYLNDREIPFANHMELTKQLTVLKKEYIYAKDLAQASLPQLFGQQQLNQATRWEANYFASAYYENLGDLKFKLHPLPDRLQFSPLYAALNDAKAPNQSPLLAGNFYDCNIEMGRYDADYGNWLVIYEQGNMRTAPSELPLTGQVKKMAYLTIKGRRCFIIARNDEKLLIISH